MFCEVSTIQRWKRIINSDMYWIIYLFIYVEV